MINVPLLRKTLEHIESHPEEWNQRLWAVRNSCGTAYCFAGWACVLSGYDPADWHQYDWLGYEVSERLETGVEIEVAATDLLGLSHRQSQRLFDPFNSLDDVRYHVDTLIEEADGTS